MHRTATFFAEASRSRFEAQGLTFGVQICWDNFYPEGARALALKGAQLVFSPNAAAFASTRKWETVITANAIVNGMYLFRVNRVGKEERLEFAGESFVCGPDGVVLARAGKGTDEILGCDIDLEKARRSHARRLFLPDRRPELYGGWLA